MDEDIGSAEIRLYLENARRDLKTAQDNLDLGYYHVVVSRAYYAMFYAASALLASKEIYRSKHSGVQAAFGQHFVKTGLIEKEYAQMIDHAFEARLDSDYDMIYTAKQGTAEILLDDAKQFVARVEEYFRESDK